MRKENRKNMHPKPDEEAVNEIFDSMPEQAQREFRDALGSSSTVEEFMRKVCVGNCPFCGSQETRDCSDTPLDDPTVGICLKCQVLWCLECDERFEEGQTVCGHWWICNECGFRDAEGFCETPAWECSIILDWKKKKGQTRLLKSQTQ